VNETTRGTTDSPRARRTLSCLVAGEFALAAVLLVCGALLVKAFDRVRHVDPGFRPDHVLSAVVPLSEGTRPKPAQWMAFWNDFERRTSALPGVDSVGLTTCAPLSGCHLGNFYDAEGALPRPDGKNPVVLVRMASSGYFRAIGIRLKGGRFLEDADGRADAAPVAVVNETFVRTYLRNKHPLGQRVRLTSLETAPEPVREAWFEIIGVVGDVANRALQAPTAPELWIPSTITAASAHVLIVRTAGDAAALTNAVRGEVTALDAGVPLVRPGRLEDFISEQLYAGPRFGFLLMTVFGSVGLILMTIGVYSVLAYATTRKTHEIGIRMALGAGGTDVLRMVVSGGLRLVAIGIACGTAMSVLFGRMVGPQLVGVTAHDPATLAAAIGLLTLTAVLASWIPARRAARVNPLVALRHD
jgi:putative ABC transport system permease protein